MDNDLHNFLKTHKIFSTLEENALAQLQDKFERIDLSFDNILFQHGDKPDAVYFLIHGRLEAFVITLHNQTKIVGHIDEGQIVGELAALSDEPYPYTVKALRHCVVYKLPKIDFLELCYQHPSCIFEMVHPLLSQSNNILQLLSTHETHNNIAIMPANNDVVMDAFATKLSALLLKTPDIILFSDYAPEENPVNASDLQQKITVREQFKKSSQQIIYLLKSSHTPLAKIALAKADKFYVVANASSEPFIDPIICEHTQKEIHTQSRLNLIIIHPETTKAPKHTSLWLQQTFFYMHHHVKIDDVKHYERLIRFLQEKANGLVLGGGGTRGWGHIGALKALCDQEHPIDFIGGTSVGAIIGGCYAMTESYEDTYNKFNIIVSTSKNSISWRSVTLPLVSIFDSKSFTNANIEVFENTLIEDLWLPFFCVSSNLTYYNEEIHKTGLVWEKIRASSSIPGLIPPMVINGDIHFDGGLLNNLPVDIMWQLIGNRGKTIGVDLNSFMYDSHKYHFPPIIAFKQALTSRFGINKDIYKFPRFVDLFLRGLLVGSSAKAKQNAQSATVLVNLDLKKFSLLKFSRVQAQKMVEIGYLETLSQLNQHKNKSL